MSVTYEQARDLVRTTLEPTWTQGTFSIDDRKIVENDKLFVFEVGAREFLADGDKSFAVLGPVTVVYKDDGRVDSLSSLQVAMDDTIEQHDNPTPTFS
ncbi:hypothetical protein [Streptomyces sp. NBC_01304]|uniref:hypothetical protein n=1 Tax=Streptomyces sp. NBC_01304 TaxID=2903818 RepID=UPI002E1374F4|nr:hypothetical protein OG430_48595 [Streptomyces sp. NBC_01304]